MSVSPQVRFFNYLHHRYGKKEVIFETMEVLKLQQAAVYKRVNGTTALTTDELMQLASHFNVSLDTALEHENYFSFQHPFQNSKRSLDFFEHFAFIMEPILEKEVIRSEITYLANELPVFYYLHYDYIFRFQLAIWNHLHWTEGKLIIGSDQVIDPKIDALRKQVVESYRARRVTEIWNPAMLSNLYQQILYAISIRVFADRAFIDKLVKDLEDLIHDLQQLPQQSHDPSSSTEDRPNIYINEFGNYMNILLFEGEKLRSTCIGYDMPQFILSHDTRLYDYSKRWVENIKRHSVFITYGGLRDRELFFASVEREFSQFADRVQKLMVLYQM